MIPLKRNNALREFSYYAHRGAYLCVFYFYVKTGRMGNLHTYGARIPCLDSRTFCIPIFLHPYILYFLCRGNGICISLVNMEIFDYGCDGMLLRQKVKNDGLFLSGVFPMLSYPGIQSYIIVRQVARSGLIRIYMISQHSIAIRTSTISSSRRTC